MVLTRALVLGHPSLFDPSEGRFASSALHMLSSGDWITPKIHRFSEEWIPYWAKPPLHMWLVASSVALGGASEVAVRLPSFICTLLSTFACSAFGVAFWGRQKAVCVAAIHLSMVAVFSFSPFALTDALLSATICLSYVCFALAINDLPYSRLSGFGVFFFLALGVLTKGPVALALPLVALTLWLLLTRRTNDLLRLPWIGGSLLFVSITVPWFILAEGATPGFLSYYFLEENLRRYVASDFRPLYGTAHKEPYGTIWIMLIGCSLPWSVALIIEGWRRRSDLSIKKADPMFLFVVAWALAPAVFFTFARQILPSYTYSALPALALLVTHAVTNEHGNYDRLVSLLIKAGIFVGLLLIPPFAYYHSIVGAILLFGILLISQHLSSKKVTATRVVALAMLLAAIQGGAIGLSAPLMDERKSTYPILNYINEQPTSRDSRPVAILYSDPPSALFYTDRLGIFPKLKLSSGKSFDYAVVNSIRHIIIREEDLPKLPQGAEERLKVKKQIGRWYYMHLVDLK